MYRGCESDAAGDSSGEEPLADTPCFSGFRGFVNPFEESGVVVAIEIQAAPLWRPFRTTRSSSRLISAPSPEGRGVTHESIHELVCRSGSGFSS